MKVLLALAVLTTSAVSLAADNREIQDLMYLPNAGTTFGFSEVNFLNGETMRESNIDTDTTGTVFAQTLGHSFTDRLSLQASMNYANIEDDTDGLNDEPTLSGFSDPTISARFRTMDEGFRWDILGGATISVGDAELETDFDRNNLRGGSSLFAGTQFGGKSESFQWAIQGLLRHNMESTTHIQGFRDVDSDSNNELLVKADVLARLGERTYARPHLSAIFGEDYDVDSNSNVSLADQGASSATYAVGAELQHKFSEDFMLRGGATYAIVDERSAQIEEQRAWNFLAGANYQF